MSSKPLHILFISSWFPTKIHPFRGDFVERHAWAAALYNTVSVIHIEKVSRNSHETVPDHEYFEKNGVSYFLYYLKASPIPVIGRYIDYLKRFSLYKKAFQKAQNKKGEIDLIHGNVAYPGGLLAYKLSKEYRIPYILTEHHTAFNRRHPHYSEAFKNRKVRTAFREALAVTAVSNDLLEGIDENIALKTKLVIPNVVKTLPVSEEHDNYFIHISTLVDHHKNVSGIIEAFKLFQNDHPDMKLLLVGGKASDDKERLRALAGPGIELLGVLPHEQTLEVLGKSRGLIQFSRYETFSIVVAEAICLGVPVITTACGGPEEFVTSSMGIITPQGDVIKLADNMAKLLTFDFGSTEANREQIMAMCREETVGAMFDQLYRQVLEISD